MPDLETYDLLDNFTLAQKKFSLLIFNQLDQLPEDKYRVDAQLEFTVQTLEEISLCTAGNFNELEEMMYKTVEYQSATGRNNYTLVNHFKHHPSEKKITIYVNAIQYFRMLEGKSKTGKKIREVLKPNE